MFFQHLKVRMYHSYVNFNPDVKTHYEEYKNANPEYHKKHRLKSLAFLHGLRKYYKRGGTGKIPEEPTSQTVNDGKKTSSICEADHEKVSFPRTVIIESEKINRLTPVQLAKQLLKYDVISFDIFDTLIFRPFREPYDLFDIVGAELNIADFKALRRKAECEAREKTKNNDRQISIYEIYDQLACYIDVDVNNAMNKEIEVEKKLCFPNEYMKQVFSILLLNHKEIIALSDMYLPQSVLRELLLESGYDRISKIIVSCDLNAGKGTGNLQKAAREMVGKGRTVVHVGDNFNVDIVATRKMGWDAIHYPNVNAVRDQVYKPFSNHIDASIYYGIIASHIHNGLMRKNQYYQHGFIYGGIMVTGYCEFLDNLVKENAVDKLLFVSRDANVIWKTYKEYYNSVCSEYIMWSRIAAYNTTFEKYTDEIIQRCIQDRVGDNVMISIEEVLNETGLSYMKNILLQQGIDLKAAITNKNVSYIKDTIYRYRDKIASENEKHKQAAKRYFASIVEGCKKICIVDLGWRGTSLIQLKSLLNEWFPDIDIIFAFAGLKTGGSPFCASEYMNGNIFVYLFSQEMNRDLFFMHFDRRMPLNNAITEITFGTPQPSFIKFESVCDGEYKLIFSDEEIPNFHISRDIQCGILDFVKTYHNLLGEYRKYINISPYTAYLPLYHALSDEKYIKKLFGNYEMNLMAGTFLRDRRTVIEDYMMERET